MNDKENTLDLQLYFNKPDSLGGIKGVSGTCHILHAKERIIASQEDHTLTFSTMDIAVLKPLPYSGKF